MVAVYAFAAALITKASVGVSEKALAICVMSTMLDMYEWPSMRFEWFSESAISLWSPSTL